MGFASRLKDILKNDADAGVYCRYRKIVNWRETLYFPEEIVLGHEAQKLITEYVHCFFFLGIMVS